MMKIKELMEKADISVKELEKGKIYVMLVDESVDLSACQGVEELFEPADMRILQVMDPSKVRIFESEKSEGNTCKWCGSSEPLICEECGGNRESHVLRFCDACMERHEQPRESELEK